MSEEKQKTGQGSKHHLLIDDIAFEKFTVLKRTLKELSGQSVNTSVALELAVTVTAQQLIENEDKVLSLLQKMKEKRGTVKKKKQKNDDVKQQLKKLLQ